jgi:hypothetical protein
LCEGYTYYAYDPIGSNAYVQTPSGRIGSGDDIDDYYYVVYQIVEEATSPASSSCIESSDTFMEVYAVPIPQPCSPASDCVPSSFSTKFSDILDEASGWTPVMDTSYPPTGKIIVWNPTAFTAKLTATGISGLSSIPAQGVDYDAENAAISVDSGTRIANVYVEVAITPISEEWNYGETDEGDTTSCVTTSTSDPTCQPQSSCPITDLGSHSGLYSNVSNYTDDETGDNCVYPWDANRITVSTRIELQVVATLYYPVLGGGVDQYTVLSGSAWTKWATPEDSTVQQVEGI